MEIYVSMKNKQLISGRRPSPSKFPQIGRYRQRARYEDYALTLAVARVIN